MTVLYLVPSELYTDFVQLDYTVKICYPFKSILYTNKKRS